jgi:hypothetical protein
MLADFEISGIEGALPVAAALALVVDMDARMAHTAAA